MKKIGVLGCLHSLCIWLRLGGAMRPAPAVSSKKFEI